MSERKLRARIKELETELQQVKEDREKFRADLVANLKSAIKIHGESKFWTMPSLIETFAKQIQKKEYWYW